MIALRIDRLRRLFGFTHEQAKLIAQMYWGAADE